MESTVQGTLERFTGDAGARNFILYTFTVEEFIKIGKLGWDEHVIRRM